MAFLLTYFCSTGSRRKTASFLSCLTPRVYPAHKPLQANKSARKMALDVYETQEGTHACTCCWRTSHENGEHAPWISPAASTPCFESTARIKRRSRPTDVTGSPRSVQISPFRSGIGAPGSPMRQAQKLFFGILLPGYNGRVLVQTGACRAPAC